MICLDREKRIAENVLLDIVTRPWGKNLRLTYEQNSFYNNFIMVIKRCQIEESMHFSRSFLTTDFKTVIFKYFQANDIFKGFFRVK